MTTGYAVLIILAVLTLVAFIVERARFVSARDHAASNARVLREIEHMERDHVEWVFGYRKPISGDR